MFDIEGRQALGRGGAFVARRCTTLHDVRCKTLQDIMQFIAPHDSSIQQSDDKQ